MTCWPPPRFLFLAMGALAYVRLAPVTTDIASCFNASQLTINTIVLFAYYFEAKVGRRRLLEYSICLVHMSLPLFLAIFNTHEVNNHDDDHSFCGRTAASLMVYSGKSAAGVFLRTYGILYPWECLLYWGVKYDQSYITTVAESLYCLQHREQEVLQCDWCLHNNNVILPSFPDLSTIWFLITYSRIGTVQSLRQRSKYALSFATATPTRSTN